MSDLNNQVSAALNDSSDRDIALKKSLEHVLADFHSETGTIHLLDGKTQLLQLAAQIGLPPQMLDIVKTIPVGKGIAGQTVSQNQPVKICNLQTDTSGVAKPGARATGVGGSICVPIRKDGKVIGTFGIGTMRQHDYTPEETKRLEDVADLVGARL